MLIRRHDAATEAEWRSFLAGHPFGELIAAGRGRDVPVVVPTHFHYDGASAIALHLARPNPVWEALAENELAVVSVFDAYTYIPSYWNADPALPVTDAVPTSYYASVQAICRFRVVDDPEDIAAILAVQLAALQPEGGHGPLAPPSERYAELLPAIRGLRGEIVDVRAKLKFGGNKSRDQRERIAARLAERGGPYDAAARARVLARPEQA